MRNTRSTRTGFSAGSSGKETEALAATTTIESPGMSNRNLLPVTWAVLRPVLMYAVVVSNGTLDALLSGTAVSLAGNVSFTRLQVSTMTLPSDTLEPALACPGTPGRSMNANDRLSQ